MSEDTNTTPAGRKFDGPPLNFEPSDGTYTFKVSMPKEKDVKMTSKGTPQVKVGLVGTEAFPVNVDNGDGTYRVENRCAYIKATFFGSPKALPRVAEFLAAATGNRPSLGHVKDHLHLADAIATAAGKKVTCTIKKKGDPREWNGMMFQDYEVSGFKAPELPF